MTATPTETPHDLFARSLVGRRVAGRYVVERILGKGGMGCVTAGTYPELEQRVAIKFMWPELCENVSLAARFVREARLAAKVTSPHLVRVFDVGRTDDGTAYLVMERLDGNDLGEEVDARGLLPIEEVADYMLQALQGLAEIHARKIVHRDLKPANLYLAREAGARIVKVLDFGISKENQAGKPATALTTESILGTPHYMAPEQVKDSRDVDARSDIWSVGVILYELLTRKLPFSADATSFGEVFGRILFTDPASMRAHRSDLPESLDALVMRCLARERGDRFQDVGELAVAIAPFAKPEVRYRADAVVRVLAADHPMPKESDPQIALPPTVAEGKERERPVSPPSAPAASARALGSYTQSAWDHARPKAASNRAIMAIVAVGVVAIVFVVAIMIRAPREGSGTPAVTGGATPPSATSSTSSSLPAVTPSAELASTAIVVPPPPSASAHPTVSTPSLGPVVKKPVPPVHASPSATTTKPPDLVLDRK